MVLLPGYLDDRLLVVVYGDGGPGAPLAADTGDLQAMVGKLAAALHLVALKRKIRSQQEPRASASTPKNATVPRREAA
jgi:hypothetical protein